MKTSRFVRLLSLVLCFSMILGVCPVSVFATEADPAAVTETEHTHTGGTATCKELAVCECGEAYGELADHTPAEDDDDCTTAVLCTVCGEIAIEAEEAHTPNEEGTACIVCEMSLVEESAPHVHTGGTATCKELAVCECGESYGELAAHTPNEEGTACAVCGAELEVPGETTPAEDGVSGVITAWSWIDEYEAIDPETNTFVIISASEENLISFDTVVEVLPGSVNAVIDGTETVVELAGWSCDEYPAAGVYYGNWIFKAELPEGVTVGDGVDALEVKVYFDESAGTYATGSAGGIEFVLNSSTSTDNYYNLISKKDWEIAPGIKEAQIVLNNDDGSYRQVLFVMEADLNNEYVKVINSYTGMVPQYGNYQVSGMTNQAAIAEQMGYGNVVGAMNTTLSWYTGYAADRVNEPLGFIMLDAEILFDPANCGYTYGSVGFPSVLVINKDFDEDGNPRPSSIPKVEMPQIKSAADLDGWEDQVIPVSSGYILKDGKNQSSPSHTGPAPRSVVGIKPDGKVVIMVNDGRQSPYSSGMSMYELAEVMLDLGCTYAVNCDGGGTTTWVSQRPGEALKINNSPSDGAERSTTSGILFISTAPATDEFVHAQIATDYNYYTPNSAVQFNVVPTNLVGDVVQMPADAVWQLSDDSFGTITNDGLFTSNGTIGQVSAQIVYNGEVMGEKEINVVWPTDFAFASAAMTIPLGKTVPIELVATYNGPESYVAIKEEDVTFVLSETSLGTISGFEFTSNSDETLEVTTGTLTAEINDLTAVTTVTLGKGSEVIFDFEADEDLGKWVLRDYNVEFSKAVGSHTNHEANYPIVEGALDIVTAATGKVHSGDSALAVTTDYADAKGNGWIQYRLFYTDEHFEIQNAKKLGFWIWMPEEAYANEIDMVLSFVDEAGNLEKAGPVLTDIGYCMNNQDEAGWRYFTTDLSLYPTACFGWHEGAPRQFYIQFYNYQQAWQHDDSVVNTQGKFTYFIDDITIEYSDAVDDADAPVFDTLYLVDGNGTASEMNGQTISHNTIGAEVAVSDMAKGNATGIDPDSAKAYVDGREVNCVYRNGRLSISNVTLADGLHTVKFAICDKMGNLNSVVRQITVAAGTNIPTVNLVPHDETLTNLPSGSVYYVDLVASDIEKVQKITVDLDLVNTFDWELAHADVTEGFALSYAVEKYENVATISITKTGDVQLSGSQVVASIPVRVWAPKIDRGLHKGELLKEVYLTINATRGILECTDGSVSTFTCDPVKVASELYMNQWNAPAGFSGIMLHTHTAEALDDKAATCTKNGYTGRTYCAVCESVVAWGTTVKATDHDWQFNTEGKLACANNPEELYTGTYEGKDYIDGAVITDGWVEVDGIKTAYYKDGVKLTGSHVLDGEMYTFDENGAYLPDFIYEGFYEVGDTAMYFLNNKAATGYTRINNLPYYFDENGLGYDGEYVINGDTCIFDNGTFVSSSNPDVVEAGWAGKTVEYVVYTNGRLLLTGSGETDNFGGKLVPWTEYCKQFIKSIHIGKDITYLGGMVLRNCFVATSLTFEEGSQLKTISNQACQNLRQVRSIVLPESVETVKALAFGHCYELTSVYVPTSVTSIHANAFSNHHENLVLDVGAGSYAEDYAKENNIGYTTRAYEAKNGVYNEDGTLYYYVDDVKTNGGLVLVDGYYYYASSGGACKTGKYWVSRTNGYLTEGFYFFDEETGRMEIQTAKNGVYVEDDGIYYYVDGVRTNAGLVLVDGYYYYASSGGACKTGKYWVSRPNGYVPEGFYFFDEETGRMEIEITKNGVYAEDGGIYYYVDGTRTNAGLVLVDGYYYYASSGGACKTGKYWVSRPNGYVPEGFYFFDEETAKMIIEEEKNGVYAEDGGIYYYVDGARTNAGLVLVDGYYYYASSGGACKTGKYWVSRPNGLMDAGYYTFGEDGKMVI